MCYHPRPTRWWGQRFTALDARHTFGELELNCRIRCEHPDIVGSDLKVQTHRFGSSWVPATLSLLQLLRPQVLRLNSKP